MVRPLSATSTVGVGDGLVRGGTSTCDSSIGVNQTCEEPRARKIRSTTFRLRSILCEQDRRVGALARRGRAGKPDPLGLVSSSAAAAPFDGAHQDANCQHDEEGVARNAGHLSQCMGCQ
jgi:hypothetical protein